MSMPLISMLVSGGIGRVTLRRPAARNALNFEMCARLLETFQEIDANDGVRVALLDAEGDVFCAGADLREREGKDEAWVRRRRLAAFNAYGAIERLRKPVVALVQGAAVGSGGELAMCCDFIVASTNARFQFPEVQWGTVGATQRLQRVVGKRLAKDMLYTGRVLSAEEASSHGMVARVVPPDLLESTGREIAETIAASPEASVRLTKQSIDLGCGVELETGIRIELAAIDHCLQEGSWREGVTRFSSAMGKRRVSST